MRSAPYDVFVEVGEVIACNGENNIFDWVFLDAHVEEFDDKFDRMADIATNIRKQYAVITAVVSDFKYVA